MSIETKRDLGVLVLRLSLGAMFIAHALLKVLVFTLPGTIRFFEQVGYPGWTAYVVVAAELGGGLALVAGVLTRLVAVMLLPVLAGAALVHWPNGWVFSAEGGGWEYPAFLAAVSLAVALADRGAYSLLPDARALRAVRAGPEWRMP
jgi:putative oxidoreductase